MLKLKLKNKYSHEFSRIKLFTNFTNYNDRTVTQRRGL